MTIEITVHLMNAQKVSLPSKKISFLCRLVKAQVTYSHLDFLHHYFSLPGKSALVSVDCIS